MAHLIYDSQIPDLLADLAKDYRVLAPVEKDPRSFSGQFAFREYGEGDRLALSYGVTVLPPKEFLFPPKETLFEFSDGKTKEPQYGSQLLFGLSYEDLFGVELLTKIFLGPVEDIPYQKRRESTVVIGLDRLSPPTEANFDLYLQEVEKGVFAATAGSKIGKKILATNHFKKHDLKVPKVLPKKDPILSDPELPKAVRASREHPIWQELSGICFGCGICSYVCPLCYCFETEDELDLCKNSTGERCRSWDSCMLKNFAATSAHNFRAELPERIYNWYFHKFVRMPKEYGFNGCVDCNRCTIYCPAKISYQQVLRTLLTDYKKRPKK